VCSNKVLKGQSDGGAEISKEIQSKPNQSSHIASDVVKVKGEDPDLPDTPGYLRWDRVRLGRRRSWIVGASPLARSR